MTTEMEEISETPQAAVEATDEQRSEKRAAELAAHLEEHRVIVRQLREQHPVPLKMRWEKMTDQQRRTHVELTKQIAMANRAYNRRVRETCARHRIESGPERPLPAARVRNPSRQED